MQSEMCPSELQLKADEEQYESEKKAAMEDLKLEINNFLWMKLSGLTTLDEAERIANWFYEDIHKSWDKTL
jgi:hypothetical protein